MNNPKSLLRPNIRGLKPYSSARDEFYGEASVYLDANENPYNRPYNRYPDPVQRDLKRRISRLKDIGPEYIFTGNGSDEAIDLVMRAFCEPGIDRVITLSPSYGMYEVAAQINQIRCIKVPLSDDFRLDGEAVLNAIDIHTKLVYICSPNNPTGNLLDREEIYRIMKYFRGIVVVDEAYIDFASLPSLTRQIVSFPRLVVLQTLSKAWGAAGIRLGMAFASPEIIDVLNMIKYPYNVSRLTQEYAMDLLSREEEMKKHVRIILRERARMEKALAALPFVVKVYPSDANFLLVRVDNADATYRYLVEQQIIVRNRHTVALCENCLRITVGTPEENSILMQALQEMNL
jgi:histidinol-phosphate aminotransferase